MKKTDWSSLVSELEDLGQLLETNGGVIPHSVFHAIGRIIGWKVIEMVTIRRGLEGIEMLYISRPVDDHEFQGLHGAGSVQRIWKGALEKEEDAIRRLIRSELGEKISTTIIADLGRFEEVVPPRGMECSHLIMAMVDGEVEKGEWHPWDKIPGNVLWHHRDVFIPVAQEWIKTHLI